MPSPTVQLNTRVAEPMHKALAALARRQGTSMAYEVGVAIRAHLDADKQRRGKQ